MDGCRGREGGGWCLRGEGVSGNHPHNGKEGSRAEQARHALYSGQGLALSPSIPPCQWLVTC